MRLYLRTLAYFRRDLAAIVFSCALLFVSMLASLLEPFPIAILFDTVFQTRSGGEAAAGWATRLFIHFAPAGTLGRIELLAVITFALRAVQEVLSLIQRIGFASIGYRGLLRVRCDLFRKLQEMTLGYHRAQPQGDAIYRLSYDTTGFQSVLSILVNTILLSLATLVAMAIIMFSINWRLTLMTLAVAPLMVITTKQFAGRLRRVAIAAKQTDSDLTTAIQRSMASVGLVQAFGRESDEFARFATTADNSYRASVRMQRNEMTYWFLVGVVFAVGSGLLFGYGGYLVWRDQFVNSLGAAGLTIGQLYIFLRYVHQLYTPIQSLTGIAGTLQTGIAGVSRVFEVLDQEPVIRDSPDAKTLPLQPRTLELDRVSFEYRPGEPVLIDATARIEPGQSVAFVGSSGVGKTTLLNLLPRFYDPTAGALKLDGIDIRSVRIRDLRRHIALVLQDNIILPTSVAENIAYGRPDASPAEIRQAAAQAGAAEFIDKMPSGYDTVVSESGSNLSGGQRQRIGIARALLTQSPILVLDEPTSALDARHEAMIVQTLHNLKGARTIIIVSHRLSTVAHCDCIYVMDQGRIVEQGTHDELLAAHGVYTAMAQHQLAPESEPRAVVAESRP